MGATAGASRPPPDCARTASGVLIKPAAIIVHRSQRAIHECSTRSSPSAGSMASIAHV
jgi:hypothetical protein